MEIDVDMTHFHLDVLSHLPTIILEFLKRRGPGLGSVWDTFGMKDFVRKGKSEVSDGRLAHYCSRASFTEWIWSLFE